MLRKTLLASLCAGALISVPAIAAAPKALQSEQGSLEVTTITQGLEHPWALAFLPDRQGMLVTERPGNLRVVTADGKLSEPISGVPGSLGQGAGRFARCGAVAGLPAGPACVPVLRRGRWRRG
jgi:glucose/arabinose dehydrogenase